MKDASAPREWRFPLTLPEGAVAVLQEDGGVELTVPSDGAEIVVGTIAPPWAKDANGNAVPTSYRLEGSALVQTVGFTTGTAFPVVADPQVRGGTVFGTIRFNKNETNRIAAGGAVGAFLTGRWARLAGKLLPVNNGIAAFAGVAIAMDKCVAVKYPEWVGPVVPYYYSGGYCK